MNREDALTAKGLTSKRKMEEASDSQYKKKGRKNQSLETKFSKSNSEALKRKMNFTPLVTAADKILM